MIHWISSKYLSQGKNDKNKNSNPQALHRAAMHTGEKTSK